MPPAGGPGGEKGTTPMTILTKKEKFRNFSKTILDYLPDPLGSLEDYRKFTHEDLNGMSKGELWNERKRAEISLAMLDRDKVIYMTLEGCLIMASEWLQERLKAVIEELRRITSNNRSANYSPVKQGSAEGWI